MWDTFLPDLLVAFFGAVLTVGTAVMSYVLKLRIDEKRALQSLINELHRRRSLRPGADSMIAGAARSDDYLRVNASIASIREEIRTARDRARQLDRIQEPLSNMTRACNQYLSLSAATPDAYAIYLGELRRALSSSVRELADRRRGVVAHEPGAGTL